MSCSLHPILTKRTHSSGSVQGSLQTSQNSCPPFTHLGRLLRPPAAFPLRLPLDFPPLKITCNSLPGYHPLADVFPLPPLKWFLLKFHPSPRPDRIFCFQCLTCGQSPPFKGRATLCACQKDTPVLPAVGVTPPGIPTSQSALLPEEFSCFVF